MLSDEVYLCKIYITEPLMKQNEYLTAVQCLVRLGYSIEHILNDPCFYIMCLNISGTGTYLVLEKTINALAFVWKQNVKGTMKCCSLEGQHKIHVQDNPYSNSGSNSTNLSWEIQTENDTFEISLSSTIHNFELNELLTSSSSQDREAGLLFQVLEFEKIQEDYMKRKSFM